VTEPLLEVRDLHVSFPTRRGVVLAVRGVTFEVAPGEKLGIVGESGSGKTVTAKAIVGLLGPPGRIEGGDILWRGRSLFDARHARTVRGREIAFIPQDPTRSLNPLTTIGHQLGEVLRFHVRLSRADARDRGVDLLRQVGISLPERRMRQHPHEMSGGMQQRVLIAMALACGPSLLIADEPTTALDATIQAQILELIEQLQEEMGLAVLLITHAMGVVARLCDSAVVMYSGRVMEHAAVDDLFARPGHPYSFGLLRSMRDIVDGRPLVAIAGSPPDQVAPPSGCPFHPRCELADDRCRQEMPPLERHDNRWEVACWKAFDQSLHD
jgi:peptide/nickel transport system ATP-binding protein